MIALDNDYFIDADDRCYMLVKLKPAFTKAGEPKYEENGERSMNRDTKGYYTRLSQAISAYSDELDREIVKNGSMTLRDGLNAILESRESVKKLIRESIPELKVG